MVDAPAEVLALRAAWAAWQGERSFPFIAGHCINGTRVVIDTLRRFGIKARPLSVEFLLFNRAAHDLFDAGVRPADWPPHAHSLGIGPGAPPGNAADGRWDGHLVAEGASWTLDISALAFNRPGRIVVPAPILLPRLPASGRERFIDAHDQIMYVGRWPENNAWRTSPGWLNLHPAEVDEAEARTRIALDTEESR